MRWMAFVWYLLGLVIGFGAGVEFQRGQHTSYVALQHQGCETPAPTPTVEEPEPAPALEQRKIAARPEVVYHDQAATPGFTGYAALGVRDDDSTFKARTNGDYTPILMDKDGFVRARCEPVK